MSLWVDKYRPTNLSKLTIHEEITSKLSALAKSEELPHLLFYGPAGAGKKTRVNAMLREIFGAGADRVKLVSLTAIAFIWQYLAVHQIKILSC